MLFGPTRIEINQLWARTGKLTARGVQSQKLEDMEKVSEGCEGSSWSHKSERDTVKCWCLTKAYGRKSGVVEGVENY